MLLYDECMSRISDWYILYKSNGQIKQTCVNVKDKHKRKLKVIANDSIPINKMNIHMSSQITKYTTNSLPLYIGCFFWKAIHRTLSLCHFVWIYESYGVQGIWKSTTKCTLLVGRHKTNVCIVFLLTKK